MNPVTLSGPRLDLLPAPPPLLETILSQDLAMLSQALGTRFANAWYTFGLDPFQWTLEQLKQDPEHSGWMMYLTILRSENRVIGTCGYKGKPDDHGVVEIGYEIAEDYQLRGLATESAEILLKHAFSFPQVKSVIAHTLAETNESGSVLKKNGMEMVDELVDPDEGPVWQWRIDRKKWEMMVRD